MDYSDFFRTEADQLLRFCWILALDADDAADLAQEAMERAYRNWDKLALPNQNPAGWVRTVAINLSNSRWRRVNRLGALLPRLARPESYATDVAEDPDLQVALAGLAPRQRQVVALRYWADLPLRECARQMEVSIGTVKQHLARAHRHLAGVLEPSILEELVL